MIKTAKYIVTYFIFALILGIGTGALASFFLNALAWVTQTRIDHEWLIYFLPICGLLFVFLYKKFGGNSHKGNNLIIDSAAGGGEKIQLRLIPLTLFGTITAHLFGASVGREGTAFQMGGALADNLAKLTRGKFLDRDIVIISGIAAGFSAVFGTPIAGTIFALEILAFGYLRKDAIYPALLSAFFANQFGKLFGAVHMECPQIALPMDFTIWNLAQIALASIVFGVVALVFVKALKLLRLNYARFIKNPYLIMLAGAIIVIIFAVATNHKYEGLSLDLLQYSFTNPVHPLDFLGKLAMTVLSLGAGFQGGEVTPLFVIGATLGNSIAVAFGLNIAVFAACGFVGVFSGATKAPIACFIMGVELFGAQIALYLLVAAVVAYVASGREGIYASQR